MSGYEITIKGKVYTVASSNIDGVIAYLGILADSIKKSEN